MYYIAYGSNMNLEQMKRRCPFSKIVGNGEINGWKLVFNVHLDVVKSKKDFVPVVVWDIDKRDWKNLDMYEGYPEYYIRKTIPVRLDKTGKKVNAVIYVMAKDRKGICPPTESYFDTCLEGAKENGLSTRHLYEALIYSFYNETKYNQYTKRSDVY